MSVQLVAPKGQFTVENRSPETQWIDNRLGVHGDNYATWRWRVTPTKSGQHPMQLTISARIVGGKWCRRAKFFTRTDRPSERPGQLH